MWVIANKTQMGGLGSAISVQSSVVPAQAHFELCEMLLDVLTLSCLCFVDHVSLRAMQSQGAVDFCLGET